MAEIYKVEGLVGVNLAQEPVHTQNAQVWNNGNNVLFLDGATMKVYGHEEGLGIALTKPECIVPLRESDSQNYWWAYVGDVSPNDSRIYRIVSKNSHQNVTPVDINMSFVEGGYRWTGDTINGVPYVTRGIPYFWNGSTFESMKNIPRHDDTTNGDNAGDPRVRFNTVRTYRNFLIGLNFFADDYEGSVENGWGPWDGSARHDNGVWWSHFVVGKNIDASFKDADPLLSSGWNFLGGGGGPIIDGKVLRDSFIVYRERSVWQMQLTGGINVFSFKELFNDAGCLGLDCILEVEGRHLVVGQSDVYMHNGVQKQSIAEGAVRKDLFNRIDERFQNKVFIVGDYHNKNAWICIPDVTKYEEDSDRENSDGSCTTAFVFNWRDNSWSIRDLPNVTTSIYTILTAADDDPSWVAVEEGGPLDGNGEVPNPPPGTTWEETSQEDVWGTTTKKYSSAEWGLVLGSSDNKLYTQTKDYLFNGNNFKAFVDKYSIDMGSPWVTKHISRIIPRVRNGIVNVYTNTVLPQEEGVSWQYLGEFNSQTDTHLACRVAGRYLGVRFEIPETSTAEIKGFEIEYTPQGRR